MSKFHLSAPPFDDEDGWFFARCECGYEQGPFPDMETTIDALMGHAREQGYLEAKGDSRAAKENL